MTAQQQHELLLTPVRSCACAYAPMPCRTFDVPVDPATRAIGDPIRVVTRCHANAPTFEVLAEDTGYRDRLVRVVCPGSADPVALVRAALG